jgi:Flp pilus assembly pilin Flp
MIFLVRRAVALYRDESGSELLEYALVTAVLSMAVAAAFAGLSSTANGATTGSLDNVSNYGVNPP